MIVRQLNYVKHQQRGSGSRLVVNQRASAFNVSQALAGVTQFSLLRVALLGALVTMGMPKLACAEDSSTTVSKTVSAADTAPSSNAEIQFNPLFLGPNNQVDLSRFAKGNPVEPGTYRVDLAINQSIIGRYDIVFVSPEKLDPNAKASDIAVPCFNKALLVLI